MKNEMTDQQIKIGDYKMVPTTKEVYRAIYTTTEDTLGVQRSIMNTRTPQPYPQYGRHLQR